MSLAPSASFDAFERCLEPVLGLLTEPQVAELLQLRGSPALQQRMAELFSKSNEGELSPAESEEYEGYIRANNYLAILQAKARSNAKRIK